MSAAEIRTRIERAVGRHLRPSLECEPLPGEIAIVDDVVAAVLPLLEKAGSRGDHWKRVAVEMEQDRDRLLDELRLSRSLRLEWSAIRAALNPEVHTSARTIAYLTARGWVKDHERRGGEVWAHKRGCAKVMVFVPLDTSYADWDKKMAEMANDVAGRMGTGELDVLAGVAASGAAAGTPGHVGGNVTTDDVALNSEGGDQLE
jgi:hypothetical protein